MEVVKHWLTPSTTLSGDDVLEAVGDRCTRDMLESHCRLYSYAHDNLAHYQLLMERMLPYIIREYAYVEAVSWDILEKHGVSFDNPCISKPTVPSVAAQPKGLRVAAGGAKQEKLMPQEARDRSLTYSCNVLVDVTHRVFQLIEVPAGELLIPPFDPSGPLAALAALPNVMSDLRRRSIWWDMRMGPPDALQVALKKDAAESGKDAAVLLQAAAEALSPEEHSLVKQYLSSWAEQVATEGSASYVSAAPPSVGVASKPFAAPAVASSEALVPPMAPRKDKRWMEKLKSAPLVYKELPLFQVPCMVRSLFCNLYDDPDTKQECEMDQGGYYIIRGNPKIVRSQKVQRNNVHIVEGTAGGPVNANIRSLRADDKYRSSSTLFVHLASGATGGTPLLTVDVPFVKKDQPIVAIFRLLGFDTQEDIESVIWPQGKPEHAAIQRLFLANMADPLATCPLQEVYDAVSDGMSASAGETDPERRRRQVHQQIMGELLPHVGYDDTTLTRLKKALYLGVIIRRMMDVHLGLADGDDRDFEGNKAVEMSAAILARMIRQQFAMFTKALRNRIYDRCRKAKHLDVASLLMHMDSLSRDINKAFSDGEVTVQKGASNTGTGVILMLQQGNFLTMHSDLERVTTPLPRDGKYTQMRSVDPTQVFSICPIETPEGQSCLTLDTRILLGDGVTEVELRDVISRAQAGDPSLSVWTVDPATGVGSPTAITAPFIKSSKEHGLYEVRTLTGKTIKATGDHPFLTPSGMKKLDDLIVQDLVAEVDTGCASNSINYVPLSSKTRLPDEDVADFTTIADTHNFVANGFCVSNCGLLNNLAVFARVRLGTESHDVCKAVLKLGEFAASMVANAHDTQGIISSLVDVPPTQRKTAAAWCLSGELIKPLTSLESLTGGLPASAAGFHFLAAAGGGGGGGGSSAAAFSPRSTMVYVNSEPVAVTQHEALLAGVARAARRAQLLPFDCSIVRAPHGILISTDMGMTVFPLLYLPALERLPDAYDLAESTGTELWTAMVRLGIVEYMDPWELLEYRAAFTGGEVAAWIDRNEPTEFPYSHVAPHPCAFFGTSASTIPFANHNQAPRNAYQSGMAKQAISTPAMNIEERMDIASAMVNWYPQKPMASTDIAVAKRLDDWPMGQNAIIAFAPYGGCSQEDSIIINGSSLDRGFQRADKLSVIKITARKRGIDTEVFEHPLLPGPDGLKTEGVRGKCNYDKIGVDGLPEVGTPMVNGDIIAGKTMMTMEVDGTGKARKVRRDRSYVLQCEPEERYIVDKVMLTTNKDGQRMVRVRLRSSRSVIHGDKLSARHGQKGTVGCIYRQEDMPYVADGPNEGMTPDLIINVHSMNGRMTIGMLLEMLYSNLGLARGEFVDATPFRHVNARWACEELVKDGWGVESYMMNGMTGERMSQPWFLGSCFYQRLKHMVLDKIAARQRGLRAVLTHQPIEGRAKEGGQRVGEMEKDAFLAHGAAFVIDDRLRVASDAHDVPVCTKCGGMLDASTLGSGNATLEALVRSIKTEDGRCRSCGASGQKRVVMPTTYCFKLLASELSTAGIQVVSKFSNVEEGEDDDGFEEEEGAAEEDEDATLEELMGSFGLEEGEGVLESLGLGMQEEE